MSDYLRADFEATLDDIVDVYLRQIRRMPSGGRQFRRAAILICVVSGMFAMVAIDAMRSRPARMDLLLGGVVGAVVGVICTPLYDRILATRARKVLGEYYAARVPMRCEIELRPTGLWVRQDQGELLLDWDTAKSVEDTADDIELWFRWGLVVVRNRGFATLADRERFLADARARVPDRKSTRLNSSH